MNTSREAVFAIGECMLELSECPTQAVGRLQLGFGGDTLNTAIYLSRLGVPTGYMTALGDDRHSDWLINHWQQERIDTRGVERIAGTRPGLYWINTDQYGEREFSYWRREAPVRQLLDDDARVARLSQLLLSARYVYLSGITLSLFEGASWDTLLKLLDDARNAGASIVFDGNYRPAGWQSKALAQRRFEAVCQRVQLALPTFDDEQQLFGDSSPQATCSRLASWGVAEVVVKHGADGCYIQNEQGSSHVPVPRVVQPLDTTAAGDSFNAGYLAARFKGEDAKAAALSGHELANIVIQHRGAIVPIDATASLRGSQ